MKWVHKTMQEGAECNATANMHKNAVFMKYI